MQNQSSSMKIALVLWALGFTTPFFFLMWEWALFILIFVSIISPLISLLLYAPFKNYATEKGVKTVGFISGVTEGLVSTGLIGYLAFDTVVPDITIFSCLLVFAYITNQIARVVRERGDTEGRTEEVWGLWGYFAVLPVTILVWMALT